MYAPMESELLRTLIAVADTGSFTSAAERVERTQSAVSMQIKKLEAIAGRSLFDRRARGVSLTSDGEALVARARRIMALLDQATEALRTKPLTGVVRVGVPEEFMSPVLRNILTRFTQVHSGVHVTVTCETTGDLLVSLREGALDLVIAVVEKPRSPGEVLTYDSTVWAASAQHLAQDQTPVPIALFEQGCWWRDPAIKQLETAGKPFRVAYVSRSLTGIQAAVSSGIAIAAMSRSSMPPESRALGEQEGFPPLQASSVVLRVNERNDTPAVRGLARAIRDAFVSAHIPSAA